jgi:DNA helicase-2/ATP-dependent DNA helicase PcrA
MEENIFPSYRSVDGGPNALEEERRLFYVAMTRAMTKLYITFAQGRMLFGQVKFNGPSRFIDEMPEKLYTNKKFKNFTSNYKQDNGYENERNDDHHYSQESKYDDEPVVYQIKESFHQPKFPKGSRVMHTLYGPGKVESSEGSGPEEKVLIKFNDGNKKKFMVKFAPISMI